MKNKRKSANKKELKTSNKDLTFDQFLNESYDVPWTNESKSKLSLTTLKSLHQTQSWVYTCCDLYASEISACPLKIYKKTVENNEIVYKKADEHPFKLFDKPNIFETQTKFIYRLISEYVLMGNAIIYPDIENNFAFVLPTESVNVDVSSGIPKYYFYLKNGTGIVREMKDIIHLKKTNLIDISFGLSPFIPATDSLLFNKYSKEFLNGFYEKGITSQLILSMENAATPAQLAQVRLSVESSSTGRRNQRRAVLLPKGVKYDSHQAQISDPKLIDYIKLNREEIINILRIPKHALSLAETGSLGSEEHKYALKYFWQSGITPTMTDVEQELTQFFSKQLGPDYCYKFDTSNVQILKDDQIKKAELGEKLLKTHTVNEVRKELYSKEKVEGGDIVIGLQPKEVQATQEQTDNNTNDNTDIPEDENENEPQQTIEPITEEEQLQYKTIKEKCADFLNLHDKLLGDVEQKEIRDMTKFSADFISQQAVVSIKSVIKVATKQIDTIKTKAKNTDDKIEGKEKDYQKAIEKELNKLVDDWVDGATTNLIDVVDYGHDLQMNLIFNEQNKEAIAAISEKNKAGRRQQLVKRQISTFQDLTKTSTENVMKIIKSGLKNQDTIKEVALKIGEKYKIEMGYRAERIARTETLTAVSIGQAEQMKSAKQVLPDLIKIWVTAKDERVRASHVNLEGKRKKVDDEFENGLQYPRDPKSKKAAEIINCRCSFISISEKDIEDLIATNK